MTIVPAVSVVVDFVGKNATPPFGESGTGIARFERTCRTLRAAEPAFGWIARSGDGKYVRSTRKADSATTHRRNVVFHR
jgi:hypothetical protein